LGGLLLARGQRAIALGAREAGPSGGGATGGGPLPGFQLYTVTGGYPAYDPAAWRLAVEGLVHTPLSLSLADLRRLPQVAETDAFHCVTGWVVPGVRWQGVRIADLLARAGVRPEAAWITFDSFDGVYTDSLSLSQATAPGVLLALRADGRPLARQQGAPLRLFVPQMYGYKSVKWVGRLRLVASREIGYWEQRGYGPDAYLGTVNGWTSGGGLRSLLP
jgi:DMSO/TMAO reductase YedYZ molybdopterin-dependent catalytic subunit